MFSPLLHFINSSPSDTHNSSEKPIEPIRLPENALAAKDTSSWQESLDTNLTGLPTPVYIGSSQTNSISQNQTTKVSANNV